MRPSGGARWGVEDLAHGGLAVTRRCGGCGGALDTQALEGEGGPGAVSPQPLSAGGVACMDADGGVKAETAGRLPGEHVADSLLVEETAALEEAQHAALHGALEAVGIVGREMRRFMEHDGAVCCFREQAFENRDVEVEWGLSDEPKRCRKETAPASAGSRGRKGRIRLGRESTHWRRGSGGRTGSVRWAATSTMRRALQEGQTPRPLQEKATRRSAAQASQRMRAKPWARMPQRR